MEIKIIEQTDKKLVFDLVGEDHTFANALKEEIANDENVKLASYKIEHPLIGIPRFLVETKKGEVVKILSTAAKKLKKNFEKVHGEF